MAQITIQGTIKDTNGTIPTSGTLTFALDNFFIDSAGIIVPAKSETSTVSAADGTSSGVLGSSLDAPRSPRSCSVSFSGVVEGVNVTQSFGSISLAASPTTVQLKDLIISGFSGGTAVTPTLTAADVSLTLRESDQTLPAGLWRVRVNGDILTFEKNTAAGGDFSTLTEIFRSTASLFTVNLNQRLSSTEPRPQFYESDQAADEKLWDFDVQAKVLTLRTRTDADGAGVSVFTVTRGTGTAVSSALWSTDLLFTDATYDIGKVGATRPRDLFMSRNLTVGGTAAITGHITAEGVTSTGATGTGKYVFDTAPSLSSSLQVATSLGINTAPGSYEIDIQVANSRINLQAATGTNGPFLRLSNTATTAFIALENSAGTNFGIGAAANA